MDRRTPLALAAILLLGEPARGAEPAECRTSRLPPLPASADADGFRRLSYRTDVDGDGEQDVLRVEDSSGSGGGLTSAVLSLGSGEVLEAGFDYWFSQIVWIGVVPKPLTEPRHRAAAELIEEALFRRVCQGPDPSLEWLLRPSAGLRWIDGPPVLPETYAFRRAGPEGEEWVWYGGHNHSHRLGQGPHPPQELARAGERVLLGTSHGVILTDPGRRRHAWIHVSTPPHKLRWPSVWGARLEGGTAVITLSEGDGYLQQPGTRTTRVDLSTGAIEEGKAAAK